MLIMNGWHEKYNNDRIIKFGDRRSYIYSDPKSIKEISEYDVYPALNSISGGVPINRKSDSASFNNNIAYNSDRYCSIFNYSDEVFKLGIAIHGASISLDGKIIKVRHRNLLS